MAAVAVVVVQAWLGDASAAVAAELAVGVIETELNFAAARAVGAAARNLGVDPCTSGDEGLCRSGEALGKEAG